MPSKNNPETVHYDEWVSNLPEATDKVVAITGTSSGTGFWAAAGAIRKNAKAVFLLNRSSERADESLEKLKAEKEKVNSTTELIPVDCDLMSFKSVEQAAVIVNTKATEYGGLTTLANNAGIMAFPDKRTVDGYDKQMQTNHLSHFLLTKLLMPSLKSSYDAGKEVRVVQQSSAARLRPHPLIPKYFEQNKEGSLGGHGTGACLERYHQSKLCNSVFGMALDKKLVEQGFDTERFKSVVAEPGYPITDIGKNIIQGHNDTGFFNRITKKIAMHAMNWSLAGTGHSAADGSLSMLECMFGVNVDSGDFYHPQNKRTGTPKKVVAKQVVVEDHYCDEAETLSQTNQDLLWAKSEEACGKFFN